MFSDLCSSTLLGHGSDPEVLDVVLREVKAAAARVVAAHDGVVNQFYGDGVMAIFGFPTPREDDVRRAAEAALELHRVVRNLSFPSLTPPFSARLHSGIHSGLVLVREGDPAQGLYEMIGDPINTAAGFSASAGADEILVDAPTIRGVLPFFDVQEIEPLRLKGKPDPMPAFRLQGRSAVATRFEARALRGLTPFVGRERELDRLALRLREVRQRRLCVVRLVGDAGIGKTRAIEEFIGGEEARECAVYRGYCESEASVAPLQPFLLMLEQTFQLAHDLPIDSAIERIETGLGELGLERHASEILRILALRSEPPGSGASDGQRHLEQVTAQALVDLILALASSKPVVLFIDDWQWVDDASRQVVASLLRSAREAPVLLLTASRQLDPSDAEGDSIEILQLAPFEESESAQAVHALLPDELDLGMASILHGRSGGNPLFLEELCQLLGAGGVPTGPGPDVPVTLHGLIEARVHRLPPEQAELLRAAAVIGNVIPYWLLEQISGYGQDDEILRELIRHDLIHPGETAGTFRFKHGITREVVYRSVGLAQRRALHLRIGAILEQHPIFEDREEPYEALAYHHAGGADHLKASRYAELAGDKAMASATLDRARQQYAAALASLDRLEPTQEQRRRWLEISRRKAFACLFSPAPEQLETLGRAAEYAAELGDLDALGHARLWLGFINYCLGNHKKSVDHYQQGLRVAEDAGHAKLIAELRARLGEALATAFEYPEALLLLDQSLEAKERLKSPGHAGAAPGSAYAISWKACIKAELGDFAQAHDLMAQALEAVRGSGSPVEGSILSLHAIILSWQGRWKECIEISELVRATAERVNGPYLFARSRSEDAYARYMLSGDPEALAVLRRTTEWLETRKICLYISMNYGCLTDAMAREGDAQRARDYGHRALERAALYDRVGQGMACRALARLEMGGGETNPASAERYLAMAMESAQARGSEREMALARLGQAELSARCGRRSETEALLARARVALQRMDMRWHDAEAQRLADTL